MNEEFKHFLLNDLLTDSWGGWKELDREFLERLCERVEEVADKYVSANSDVFTDLKGAANVTQDSLYELFEETITRLEQIKSFLIYPIVMKEKQWLQLWKDQFGI